MKFEEQKIKGVFLIQAEPFMDERGVFRRHFCQREFLRHGIDTRVAQANVSENIHKHTLRGFHFQLAPHGEGKTISCLAGSFYDIVVDLRPYSPTFLQWISLTIRAKDRTSLHVPAGCANAFLTLEDNMLAQYYVSDYYHKESEQGIRYNDPLFHFEWPYEPAHISAKDASFPNFDPKILNFK